FGNADHHLGQHQCADHDDRGKGRRPDPRRRRSLAAMNPAARAKAMLIEPAAEWARIARESGDPAYLLSRYVVVLALVPAVFGFIGSNIVGMIVPGTGLIRASLFNGGFGAIFAYVLAFGIVLVLGLIINALAPLFGAQRDFDSAFKLAVYSYTPV